jgi:hypothetical protein
LLSGKNKPKIASNGGLLLRKTRLSWNFRAEQEEGIVLRQVGFSGNVSVVQKLNSCSNSFSGILNITATEVVSSIIFFDSATF